MPAAQKTSQYALLTTKKTNQACNKQCNALFSFSAYKKTAILYSELWAIMVPQTFRPEIPTSGGVPDDIVKCEVATYKCQSEIWGICFHDFGMIKSWQKKTNKQTERPSMAWETNIKNLNWLWDKVEAGWANKKNWFDVETCSCAKIPRKKTPTKIIKEYQSKNVLLHLGLMVKSALNLQGDFRRSDRRTDR